MGLIISPTTAQTFSVPAVSVPTISSISVPDGNYSSGDKITVTVNFSELVNVNLTVGGQESDMSVKLNIGGTIVDALYTGGSGSSALTFSYSVSSGLDGDGIDIVANSITKNASATIQNASNVDVLLDFSAQNFANAKVDAVFSLESTSAIWLDAQDVDGDGDTTDQTDGTSVAKWVDKSGNGHHAEQTTAGNQASLDANGLNNRATMLFDGNDKYKVADSANMNDQRMTIFSVAKRNSSHRWSNTVISKKGEQGDGWQLRQYSDYSNKYAFTIRGAGEEDPFSSINTDLNTAYLLTASFDTVTRKLDIDGSNGISVNDNNFNINYTNDSIGIGGRYGTSDGYLHGQISEVLYFNRVLSTAEKTQVNNYLASKWDTGLLANSDYYDGDTSAKGDYDFNVNGILKLSDSELIAAARGGLTISNVDYLKDSGDSVFAGNKGVGSSTADLPSGIANMRSDTVWYFDATDAATAGGQINLGFDLAKLGLEVTTSSSDYVLLWRSTQTGQFYQIAVADSITDSSISFDGIEVDTSASAGTIQTSTDKINDGYFTVGVKDDLAPEYQSAEVSGNTVTLTFDEYLNTVVAPDASAFSVDVGGGSRNVTGVAISGKNVVLTIDGAAITDGDTVVVNYTKPASGIVLEDTKGNDATSLSNVNVGANSGIAAISGTATEGQTLTAGSITDADGTTGGSSVAPTYQWTVSDTATGAYANISGATSATFVLTQAQVGKFVKVVASYTDALGEQEVLTSAASSAVTNTNDDGSIAAITGTVTQGQTLTAGTITDADGTTGGSSVAPTYQWTVSDTATGAYASISGATSATFVLTQAQVGKFVKVVAIYTDALGEKETVTSAASSAVTNVPALTSSTYATTNGGDTLNDTIVLTLTFDGNVNGLTSGTNNTIFTIAGTAVEATWGGTDGTNTRTLTYKVIAGQNGQSTIDATALKTALIANIKDAAGNAFDQSGAITPVATTPVATAYDNNKVTIAKTPAGATMVSTGADGWNTSSSYSKEGFTGDGSVSFTIVNDPSVGNDISIGLDVSKASFDEVDYAIQLHSGGRVKIVENGKFHYSVDYVAGDTFKIQRVGSEISYYKNGTLIETSTVASDASDVLHVATSFFGNGGSIKDVQLFGANSMPVVDTTAPTISSTTISATDSSDSAKTSTLVVGDKVVVTLAMSEATTVTGTPTYAIDVGGVSKTASYVSGSGTNSLKFSYTIATGDMDTEDGITSDTGALALAGGTLKDGAGNTATLTTTAAASNTLTADATNPKAATNNPIIGDDLDGGGYGNADTITLRFNEPIDTTKITLAVLNAALSNSHTFGTATNSASVSASDASGGYATTFVITLGSDATVNVNDTITLPKANVVDANSNQASVDIVFTVPIPSSGPTAALTEPVSVSDVDTSGGYSANDTITLKFNKAVNSSLVLGDFSVAGKGFGTGATLTAGTESPAGYATEFTITLKAGTTVAQGDQISVDGTKVVDEKGNSASGNVVFTLVDITPPSASGNAVPGDVGSGNVGSYGVGDTLTINFSEGIKVSEITDSDLIDGSITLTGTGSTFGTGATIVAANAAAGLATQFTITLGSGTDVASGDTITVNADQIKDNANNSPTVAQTFSVPAVSVPTISSISVPSGNYGSGDKITVTVNFSENVTVNLNGGTMTLKLDVGGSEVLAEYKGGSGTSALTFNYYASGVIDSDGITVVANSINKNTATIKNAGNEDAELTHAQQTFASATVDAPFDLSKVASIWLDSTDIDGDGDTTDQSENDVVTRVVDKSGNGNDVTGSGGSAPVLKNLGMNNGNLSIYFDGNDNLTSGANNPNLGTAGYTYFVSASTPNRNTTDYNYLFGTRSEADGVAMFLKKNGTTYHLNSVTTNSYNGVDVGTGVTTKSFVLSDLVNPGASRTFSQDGTETSLTTLTNLVAGQQINLGSTGTGEHRLRGYINEALYFKRVLSDAEMCIVQNYLSSKWGTALNSSVDYYSGDTSANGDYDYYVTGILKLSDSNVAAGSQGGLTITNSNTDGFLKDSGDAVFAGYKSLSSSTSSVANVVWYFDVTDAATIGGKINLGFDLSKLGLEVTTSSSDYVLLWRSSQIGQFYQIAVADSISGGSISFDGIEVDTSASAGAIQTSTDKINDGYFTVGVKHEGAIGAISGTTTLAQTLSAGTITDENGTTGGSSVAPTYQWKVADTADGLYSNISGATAATFVLTQQQVGKFIKVVATYTDALGEQEVLTSAATTAVANLELTISSVTDSQSDTVTNLTVTYTVVFSHALNQSTFTSADIKLVDASDIVIDTNNWTIGTPTTSDGISWTIEVTPPTGADSIDVTAVHLKIDASSIDDIYGNPNIEFTQVSSSQSFDTTPPSALTLTLDIDTGSNTSDGITKDGVMNVAGLDTNLGSWQYSINGGSTWTTVNNGDTSFTLSAATYSAKLIQVKQTDSAGLTSAITKYMTELTVDTSIDTPTLSPANAGNISANSNFVLTFAENMSGVAGKNIVIKNSSDNAVIETIAVDSDKVTISNGVVTINPTDANLVIGNNYYIEVDEGAFTDVAGNKSAAITGSTTWNVSVNAISTSIEVAGDNKVSAAENGADITVSVTVSANSSILTALLVGDFTITAVKDSDNSAVTLTGASYNSATGVWSATITGGGLTDAETYTITADVAGSTGAASSTSATQTTQTVTVDTTAPTLGTTTIATDAKVNISEVSGGFSITGTTTGLKTGTQVSVVLNSVTYNANTLANGAWSLIVPSIDAANLTDGVTYVVTVNVSDAHGNVATQVSQNITIDRTAPVSVMVIDEVITNLPTITGQSSESSVEVKLDTDNDGQYDDGTYTVSVSGGNWALDLSSVNADGASSPMSYSDITASTLGVQVSATDDAGNTTVKTETVIKQASSYSISDSKVIEGKTGTKTMTFIVTREGDLSSAGTVDYAVDTTLSSAKTGNGVNNDYTGTGSGTVNFVAGESFKEITLTVNGDYHKEVNQKVIMNLTNPTGGSISKATGVGELSEVDTTAMSGAFSLKDVNSDLVTNAIRVRRSLDDSEMDIGFDKYGNLDADTLLKFVNNNDTGSAVTGATGYVSVWYDQSSLQENLKQTTNAKQGVIVNNGALVTTSDGATTISFNQGLNGGVNDWMSMTGTTTNKNATNIEIYATYEFNMYSSGMMFNLGINDGATKRVSVHAPHGATTYWDAGNISSGSNGRLSTGNAQKINKVQQLVFTANYNHSGGGTVSKNKVDAKQAFFVDGTVKGADGSLNGNYQSLGDTWYLMSGTSWGNYQRGKISEFLVYTNSSRITATDPTVLIGSDINNSFTYAGESKLTGIDGKAGYDAVVLSGSSTNLNITAVTLSSIELIHMQNGKTNILTINDAQLTANGSILSVLMDSGDSIVYNSATLNHSATQEVVTFGTTGNDTINMSSFNELVYGRGGSDTFVYKSWSDAAASSSNDAIADFTMGTGADKDVLNLADLLTGYSSANLADFITLNDNGTDTSIAIDRNGDSSGTDLTITLNNVTGVDLATMISDDNLILG